MVYPTLAQFCSCSCSASSVRSTNGLGHFYVQLWTFLWLLRPSSTCTLPSLLHSLCSCTPTALALPPVPLPPVLDIAPDLTLVKSTSDPYLSCSDLVPFTLHLLHRPCKTSSPFLLLLRSPTPTVVGEGCVGQKHPVPANGPAGMDLTQYGKIM